MWNIGRGGGLTILAIENIENFERCQINTPINIVKEFWNIVSKHRSSLGHVIDMGAGDLRFSLWGNYSKYIGIEIDKNHKKLSAVPNNASLKYECVFEFPKVDYNACIGNPPYIRHHDIDREWRNTIVKMIKDKLNITLNQQCNLFVYFMCLGIIKTNFDGLIALIVPYEWVSRPSVKALREYLISKKWGVHVYRFKEEIFNGVLTTASISIIDKTSKAKKWKFYEIDNQFNVFPKKNMSGTKYSILPHEKRTKIWSMRGLSPGTQKVFTLTEGERIHFGLRKRDVLPCVTSLRDLPKSLLILNKASFKKYFIDAGRRCWLIRSDKYNLPLNDTLNKYIRSIPKSKRNTSTCKNQKPWYSYAPHPVSKILYGSGFTTFGPTFLINSIRAVAIGSVHGIHSDGKFSKKNLVEYLSKINFVKRVVAHAGILKKIEVKQMNGVLNSYIQERRRNGR